MNGQTCFLMPKGPANAPISPLLEMGAYEALWLENGASFKSIAQRFSADPQALPSDFIEQPRARQCASEAKKRLEDAGVRRFGVRVHHAGDYPAKLRDARHPVEFLYYRGAWELTEKRCVAVVGSRKASREGQLRARRLAKELMARGFVVVSGLAAGIDTAVHRAALESGGATIAVAGTPLGEIYPQENRALQEEIATKHLLISQVPVLRHSKQSPKHNRLFFPERNVTMSALTEATVIVEAGETSGTLVQARAALHQERKLLILDSCFKKSDLTWPARLEKQGAIRITGPGDIWQALE